MRAACVSLTVPCTSSSAIAGDALAGANDALGDADLAGDEQHARDGDVPPGAERSRLRPTVVGELEPAVGDPGLELELREIAVTEQRDAEIAVEHRRQAQRLGSPFRLALDVFRTGR